MLEQEIGQWILNREARRDKQGHLLIYPLPPGDGGGAFEVAGINDRYHPDAAKKLLHLLMQGKYSEAEVFARDYILAYTKEAAKWASSWRTELVFRDMYFNRGPGGVAKIIQKAVGVKVDGVVGPITRAAIAAAEADDLFAFLRDLRVSREWYERTHAHRNEGSKFWKGLVNRWNAVTDLATQSSAV